MKTLKQLRSDKGLKQKKVAEAIGVSEDTIRRWENGDTYPNAPQAIELARLYGVAVDEVDWVTVRTAAPEDQSMTVTEQ